MRLAEAPWQNKSFRGPLFDLTASVLARYPEYALHRAGSLADEAWYALIERAACELRAAGVPAGEVPFAKRFPGAPARFVRASLARFVRPASCARTPTTKPGPTPRRPARRATSTAGWARTSIPRKGGCCSRWPICSARARRVPRLVLRLLGGLGGPRESPRAAGG